MNNIRLTSTAVFLFLCLISIILFSCDLVTKNDTLNNEQTVDLPPLVLRTLAFPDKDRPFPFLKGNEPEMPFVINYSTLNTGDLAKPYTYDRFEILFPEEIINLANGKTRRVTVNFSIHSEDVRVDARMDEDGNSVVRVSNFIIPDHDIAESMVRNHLRTFPLDSFWHTVAQEHNVPLNDDTEYSITILLPDEPLSGRECDSIVWITYCEQIDNDFIECFPTPICFAEFEGEGGGDEGGGDEEYDGLGDGDNGSGDDGGSSGGSSPPVGDDDDPCDHFGDDGEGDDNPGGGDHDHDEGFAPRSMIECDECAFPNPPAWCPDDEEEEEEPCDTGNEVVDNPPFQNVLQEVLTDALYTNGELIPTAERDEVMGVILDTGNGFEFIPFPAQEVSSCHMRGILIDIPPSQYENVVAMVHIHPFMPGTEIEDQRCIDARPGFIPGSTYSPLPTPADRAALARFNYRLRDDGFSNVPMVVLDEDKISILTDYNDGDNQSNSAIYNDPHDHCFD